jgi:hypothetical protein
VGWGEDEKNFFPPVRVILLFVAGDKIINSVSFVLFYEKRGL